MNIQDKNCLSCGSAEHTTNDCPNELNNNKISNDNSSQKNSVKYKVTVIILFITSLFIILLLKEGQIVGINNISKIIGSKSNDSKIDESNKNKIKLLVKEYLLRNTQPSIENIVSLYADRVDFYESGIVDKSFIILDKKHYFTTWPIREALLIGDIDIKKENRDKTWSAKFVYNFKISKGEKVKTGSAWCTLMVREQNGIFFIVSEKGAVLG